MCCTQLAENTGCKNDAKTRRLVNTLSLSDIQQICYKVVIKDTATPSTRCSYMTM